MERRSLHESVALRALKQVVRVILATKMGVSQNQPIGPLPFGAWKVEAASFFYGSQARMEGSSGLPSGPFLADLAGLLQHV